MQNKADWSCNRGCEAISKRGVQRGDRAGKAIERPGDGKQPYRRIRLIGVALGRCEAISKRGVQRGDRAVKVIDRPGDGKQPQG